MWKVLCYIYLLTGLLLVSGDTSCNLRETEDGSVCVCDSSYCDTVPKLADLKSGQYQLYSTSKAKLGFDSVTGTFSNSSASASATVTVANLSSTYHPIIGFGACFTDATGISIATLPEAAQELLLQSYFGDDGIQYSVGRVPIGGTDFSTRPYTYCDEVDETLEKFDLQPEDRTVKIPFIQRAKDIRGNKPFKLFASAWSAPIWMKTNNWYNRFGTVKDEYWQLWAEYHLKFFDAYNQNNISFWGVTTQNEPLNGLIGSMVQNIGFTPTLMRNWITQYLGPTIRNSTLHSDLKIILHDDQRFLLPILKWFVLSDDEVNKYADGIGIHWYSDFWAPAELLSFAKSDKKDLFRLATEGCAGYLAKAGIEKPVLLGSWHRAELYLNSILDDLSYDVGGWVDWNFALNETGGPTWINNEVDAPIIVNTTSGEFYKQPTFYALGHFSKFLDPDSVRVDLELAGSGVTSLAFKRPDGKIAVILRNKSENEVTVKVDILGSTEVFRIAQYSINTLLYSI